MRERLNDFDTEPVQTTSKGCGIGCLGFVGAGIVVGLLGASIGASCSARVPFTESNISAISAIGDKQGVEVIVPDYIQNRDKDNALADAQGDVLAGSLKWKNIASVGPQPNSPLLEIFLRLRGRQYESGIFGIKQAAVTIPDGKESR